MASSTQTASTSIPIASSWEHDVFLSFRGKETRKGFTGHLHRALKGKKSIKVFKDDLQLKRGTTIPLELLTAIEESRFALIVFSPDYASSKWCLDELVKIYECMQVRETIIPIFYNVEPSHVRHQSGTFEEAFKKHENGSEHNTETVQRWRTALTKVADMSGWNLAEYGEETKFIDDIVDDLYNKLVCAGCNKRVVDGGLKCLRAVWHQACLLCKVCKRPCTNGDYEEYGDHSYHKRCYEQLCMVCIVCKKPIKDNSESQGEYKEHPFWRQRYCPSHAKDGTPRCCSCERLKPRDTTYYKLDDGRKLCPDCKESIINTANGGRSIFLEVRKFYKKLNVIVEKIPVRLVSRQEIIDVMKEGNEGSDRQLPVIRAVCLFERNTTSAIMGRPSQVWCEVKEILIWYGLPRILTGSLLAQQMIGGWSTLPVHLANKCSEFERKLCQFRKHKIESGREALLQTAMNAVRRHGLEMRKLYSAPGCAAHPISAVYFEKVKSQRQMDGGDGRVRGAPGCAEYALLEMTLKTIQRTGNFPSLTH
ncbi:hypothetical protein ACLB2K_001637 [Fragaria x ananassa]